MSFTKVAPAGIGTEPGTSILIGDSLLHSTGIDIGSNTGIGVTIRKHGDATFTGIITASAFFGDGSGLEGVSSSGIGTALNDDDTNVLNKIYYVNQELSIGSTVTVNHPDTGTASYTHYQDLVVKNDADFIVADGDTFIPDILGITTSTLAASAATGGRIRAGTITNAGANGAPNFPNGLTGTAGTFTGNLNVAGVLTYEDVTNVDSVGVITARSGIKVTGGELLVGTTDSDGKIHARVNAASSTNFADNNYGVPTGKQFIHISNSNTGGSEQAGFVMNAAGSSSAVGAIYIQKTNSYLGDMIFRTRTGATTSAERLRIGSTGVLTSNAPINGQAIHTFKNLDTTSSSSAMTIEQHFNFNRTGGGMNVSAGRIIAGKEREWVGAASNQDGYLAFHTCLNETSAEKMRISSQGYVTKPNTPFFSVYGSASNQTYNQGDIITFENAVQNVGNHFKMTSGTGQYQRFIAPVAGVYLFTFAFFPNTASACRIGLRVSTALQTTPYISGCFTSWGTGSPVPSASQMLLLGADAYVDVVVANGTLTNTYDGHTTFQGILLG